MIFLEVPKGKFNKIKGRAKERNIEFDLTLEYVNELFKIQKGKCVYTNVPLTMIKKGRYGGDASLDRIDSNMGYIEGNVQWTLKKVNIAKWKLCHDEFVDLCMLVSRKFNNKKRRGKNV